MGTQSTVNDWIVPICLTVARLDNANHRAHPFPHVTSYGVQVTSTTVLSIVIIVGSFYCTSPLPFTARIIDATIMAELI